jgi:hypothetical protein
MDIEKFKDLRFFKIYIIQILINQKKIKMLEG